MTRGFGRLTRQLAVSFVAVGVAAVTVALTITALTVTGYEDRIRTHHEAQETAAIAAAAAAVYGRSDRAAMTDSILAGARRLGAVAQVRDGSGHLLQGSPGFAKAPDDRPFKAPIVVGGRTVGTIVLRFGDRGLAALLATFNAERWRARIIGGCAGALIALVVALLLAPRITAPLNRLLRAARSRAAGRLDVRAGEVSGFRDIRQLAATFDEMADVLDRQEQLRRNLVADVAHEL
ncbi:MAG TPA: HAMP domain-containing protein, partial [Streptosporangiaceae bacterium]